LWPVNGSRSPFGFAVGNGMQRQSAEGQSA
jgi:hypothetical protein